MYVRTYSRRGDEMVEFCVGDPMRTIFQLFALGVGVGGNANVGVHVGGYANFSVLDTNILVSPTQNSRVLGLDQRQAPELQWNMYTLHCWVYHFAVQMHNLVKTAESSM